MTEAVPGETKSHEPASTEATPPDPLIAVGQRRLLSPDRARGEGSDQTQGEDEEAGGCRHGSVSVTSGEWQAHAGGDPLQDTEVVD